MVLLSNFLKKKPGEQSRDPADSFSYLPSGRITKKNGSLSSNLPINVFLIFPSRTPWSEKKNTTVLLRWPPSKRMQEKNRKDYDKFVLALTLFELVIFLWFRLIVKQKLAKITKCSLFGQWPRRGRRPMLSHIWGFFSFSSSSFSSFSFSIPPLKSQSRGPNPSLKAQIPALKLES